MSKQKIRTYLKSQNLWDYEYDIPVDGTTYSTRIQDIVEKLFTEYDEAGLKEFNNIINSLKVSGKKEIIKHFEPYAKHLISQIAFQMKHGHLISSDALN